jgi:basic amino acid/polyamine antiporter, APA family
MGTLFAFILVSIALPIVRRKYPESTGFSVPGGPYIVPVISAVLAFGLILSLAFGSPLWFGIPSPWLGFVVWMLVGLCIYFAYSRSHSTVGKEEKKAA